jgi:PilZ domain
MSESPNRVLEFLTAPAKPAGEASRSNRRRKTNVLIEFAWSEGETWRTVRARLRDVSRGGASLFAVQSPALTRHARLRFISGEGSPWVECEVLEVTSESARRHRIRVQFDGLCPSFMLRMAILGSTELEAETEAPTRPYRWVAVCPEESR